jgi:hypothetical protein
MVDGFGGGWDKAQILTIMKDSRIGSFGAIALVMLLLARFCALIELDRWRFRWPCWPATPFPASRRRRCCAASTMCATRARRSRWRRASAGANSALPGTAAAAAAAAASLPRRCRLHAGRTGHALAGAPVPAADRRLYRRLPRGHAAALGGRVLLRTAVQTFPDPPPAPAAGRGICYGQLDVEAEDPQPVAERLRPLLPAGTPVISQPAAADAPAGRGPARAAVAATSGCSRSTSANGRAALGAGSSAGLLDAWAADVLHFVPPGGESAAMLQARAVDCVGALRGSVAPWSPTPASSACCSATGCNCRSANGAGCRSISAASRCSKSSRAGQRRNGRLRPPPPSGRVALPQPLKRGSVPRPSNVSRAGGAGRAEA